MERVVQRIIEGGKKMNDVMIKGISVLVTVLLGFGAAASGDSLNT